MTAFFLTRRSVHTHASEGLDVVREVYTVSEVTTQVRATSVDRARLLARDYWLVLSTPVEGTEPAAIEAHVDDHIAWLLELERQELVFVSGPLLSGPGTGPGSGVTVLRAPDEDTARKVAASDPFVRADLRTFEVYRWRLNEGSVSVSLSLGTGTYVWR
jgi:uncharacterized protein